MDRRTTNVALEEEVGLSLRRLRRRRYINLCRGWNLADTARGSNIVNN